MHKVFSHTGSRWVLLLVVALGLVMCKNELPNPEESLPIFFVEAKVNEHTVLIEAGNNQVLMQPFHFSDSLNIHTFGGFIGPLNCKPGQACPGAFELHIRAMQSDGASPSQIDAHIKPQTYGIRGPATKVFQAYKATFTSKSLPLGAAHTWYFGDGNQSNLVHPTHYYVNESDSIVEPLLTISDGACASGIQYTVDFTMPCITDINYFINGTLGGIEAIPNGNTDLWDFGTGYYPLSQNPIPSDSLFKACVKSTYMNGCMAQKCENIVRDSTVVACVANFDVTKEIVTLDDERNFGEITLFYTAPNGVRYSSKSFAQPTDSYFEIVGVRDYILDGKGDRTKQLDVRYKLRLFGADERTYITVESNRSSFSVSYP